MSASDNQTGDLKLLLFRIAENLQISGGPETPLSVDTEYRLIQKIVANTYALAIGGGGGGGGTIPSTTAILKGDGSGNAAAATAGTDYAAATSGSSVLKGNGAGGFSAAVSGVDINGPTITSAGNGDVTLDPAGTGAIVLTGATARGNLAAYVGYEWEMAFVRWCFRNASQLTNGILFDLNLASNTSIVSFAHAAASADFRANVGWDGTRTLLTSAAEMRLAFNASNALIIGTAGSAAIGAALTEVARFDTNGLAFSRGGLRRVISTQNSDYAILDTDDVILINATANRAPTLPTPVGRTGRVFTIKRINTTGFTVTLGTAAGLIDGAATRALAANESIDVISDNSNWYIH